MSMIWIPIEHAKLNNNLKADLWCINPTNGYGGWAVDCVYTLPYGKGNSFAWINENGAPIESDKRVVTHIMIVKGLEQ